MKLDPVHSRRDQLLTPLFRDTRELTWDHERGCFPPGTKAMGGADPIPYRTALTIFKELIKAESGPGQWFEGRNGPFGLHSFRIGKLTPPGELPPPTPLSRSPARGRGKGSPFATK